MATPYTKELDARLHRNELVRRAQRRRARTRGTAGLREPLPPPPTLSGSLWQQPDYTSGKISLPVMARRPVTHLTARSHNGRERPASPPPAQHPRPWWELPAGPGRLLALLRYQGCPPAYLDRLAAELA